MTIPDKKFIDATGSQIQSLSDEAGMSFVLGSRNGVTAVTIYFGENRLFECAVTRAGCVKLAEAFTAAATYHGARA